MTRFNRSLSVFATAAALLALPPLASAGEGRKTCDSLFPDLTCSEREGRYDGFVAPATAPYLFEDPFITTELSAWWAWHEFSEESALEGGHLNVMALQIRAAITDRLGLIASMDGYTIVEADTGLPGADVFDTARGINDLGLGFKYLLVDMPEHGFALSPSMRFQIPVGDRDVFHGNGDGIFLFDLSSAWGYKGFHLLSDLGVTIPVDNEDNSTLLHGHLQMDFPIIDQIRPFAGVNWYHYLASGNGAQELNTRLGTLSANTAAMATDTRRIGGLDYANLGSSGISGNDIVSGAVGIRFPVTKNVSLSGAYEIPLTKREDVLKQRVTANIAYTF